MDTSLRSILFKNNIRIGEIGKNDSNYIPIND